ncbi:g148 [Coccomyxa viridis]|uniref:glycerophosphodiester phosphodiesterase n=1 Tax=Coccomyxa viridis TaxID=1274662 RepID=A0ABP1FF07_9CHLO
MGENLLASEDGGRPLMRYRENTIHSFNTAAEAGASFVEFDVQVTADGIPVIWHDDLIVSLPEQSSDAVRTQHICELSLRDFKKLSQHRSMGTQTASSSGSFDNSSCSQCSSQSAALIDAAAQQAQHDQSSTSAQLPVGAQTARLARFFSSDQGKRMHSAQAWAVSEEDSLPTLAEVFKGVDQSVGFDIEVKMATPPELAVTPPQEIERMVTPILEAVQAVATHSSRPIVFSSFDPEICRALRQRQQRFPVLLLSTGGTCWHADERRMSIAAAIQWALECNLQGLVLDSGAVQEQSQAVALARSKGLKVLTYGLQNNDPAWVRHQYSLGVQGAIVDDVEGVVSAFGHASALQSRQSAELAA